jgi:catechol 2,3-dioxygenase-like lactoylglutathione lyase family enzyme
VIALGHGSVGSNNLDQAKAFYDALFETVGVTPLFEHPSGGRIYGKDGKIFFVVLAPFDGRPATAGNGSMHGFSFDTTEEVRAFHAKALDLGAANEGQPGERAPNFYMSYFRDLDGNKLCAFKID